MGICIASKLIYPEIRKKIESDFDFLPIESNDSLPIHEQTHVDLQICKLRDNLLVVNPNLDVKIISRLHDFCLAEERDTSKYPNCAYLDALVCGNYLVHKRNISSDVLLKIANENHFIIVDVPQGYTGCSSFYFKKLDMIVTNDRKILEKSKEYAFNSYFVSDDIVEKIELPGLNHGFIGGTMGYHENSDTLYVNGSLSQNLPELFQIIKQTGTKIIETNEPLMDIGGILFLY